MQVNATFYIYSIPTQFSARAYVDTSSEPIVSHKKTVIFSSHHRELTEK
ncbi:hypothetical protein HMPREF0305_11239 [Corynebacterium pseudogenitalium ATCC 33035]|uniref:Uncharacterized protein n=1 Tax=Corynebacterium pseudogenitalium ATCC 33035 TaxID=525264 RepID=E2S3Y7_9CORY|nr:hypothetical protein HMPREF0305_11239 [Corynebacterium pseudogenitalium ATCC 33035]